MSKNKEPTFEALQKERMLEIVNAECLTQEKYIIENYKPDDKYYQLFYLYKNEREQGIISNTMFFSEFVRNNMVDVLVTPEALLKELNQKQKKGATK